MKRILNVILTITLLISIVLSFSSCFNEVTVTFISFIESDKMNIPCERGKALYFFPPEMSRTDFKFLGWSISETEPIFIDESYIFYEDTYVYAFYELDETNLKNKTIVFDKDSSYEKYLFNGFRRLLIKNANDVPIKQITLSPAENSEFNNWYITAVDEYGRDLVNISEEQNKLILEDPVCCDIIIDFEAITRGRAKITIN